MGLFGHKPITAEWFTQLLLSILEKLPREYAAFARQVREGIVRRVAKPGRNATHLPNYVGIGFDPDVAKRYDKLRGIDPADVDQYGLSGGFVLSGIGVFNKKLDAYAEAELYFADGLICGVDSTPALNMDDFDNLDVVVGELTKRTI